MRCCFGLESQVKLIADDTAARFLLGGVVGFIGEHSLLGAAAATAFLAADLLGAGAFGGDVARAEGFDLVEQQAASEKAVEALLAGGLAFDLQTGRSVQEHYAGGGLVDILAAVAARPDEGLFDVGFTNTQSGHALGQLGFFVGADGEGVHGGRIASGQRDGNGRREESGSLRDA